MYKKIFYSFLIIVSCFVISFFFVTTKKNSEKNFQDPCPFCDEKILNNQKFYEDDIVAVLYTHKPVVSSHFLVIPKKHVERLEMLSEQEFSHICNVIKKVNEASLKVFQTSSYFILQKNGYEVGQRVSHIHFHYIGKQAGDNSYLRFFAKMILADLGKPISSKKMQKVVNSMKTAMDSQENFPL